ncbi:MAG: acetyl-CoA carboxylase biotin carboxylase subunit [Candidatus Handelsmanbacteria bacterium RIFCSPLOWO2_12_FULL_64_10]|uniref:Biotin carboxylase n=1 Tax=Handelsmanbacteria sp. (strain RIFCSPLOWO2_12_FULL_64_10) TaxID=1817868 RepID=A0A1F6D4I0_HANXR|nr:MAG: acetyl-CoA carboxylase biotin carboxylase subunit [Candidatus Handelsmanbacteria bacterium RIFCSPLOWO2_12_FULL_64_10]
MRPIHKILVANRGEIALRIIRACKELGIQTVAIYSEADAKSLHIRFADEDVCIGPPSPDQSYLNIPRILSAAEVTNADAIHPGYGFLAENADFAEICESCGIRFIGPGAEAIRKMGDKAAARQIMREAGVPVVPGTGVLEDSQAARQAAERIGYPMILKAVAGGGGRGLRIVRDEKGIERAWQMASAEGEAAFGSGAIYMERYIERPRHVEIQILADRFGGAIHVGERDCSVQRRHQKLIEVTPSPAVDEDLRGRMGEAALLGARSVGYENAGTVEFLLDEHGQFYFMEMNTRIQVEHPVTEMATRLDLVKEQIRIASGEPLDVRQEDVSHYGCAIECRINAEDPDRNFLPVPGAVTSFHIPGGPGVRVDTHVYAGYRIPPHYDSLLAKLIVHGRDRQEAVCRMERALEEFVVEGVPTTIPFHQAVMKHPDFIQGKVHLDFVERLGYGNRL